MPKLWDDSIEELHVLIRRARLKWVEKATDDSDYGLEQAIIEAGVIIETVEAMQQSRKGKRQ